MAVSLLVRKHKGVVFSTLLSHTSQILTQLLNSGDIPEFVYEAPPARKGASFENQSVDVDFPGSYIRFQGIDRSVVNLHVFRSPVPAESQRLLIAGEASGRGPASEVLAAALAAAAGILTGGSIDDGGHHWIDKDECSPEELLKSLQLSEKPQDFHAAVEMVHRRQAVHTKNPIG